MMRKPSPYSIKSKGLPPQRRTKGAKLHNQYFHPSLPFGQGNVRRTTP